MYYFPISCKNLPRTHADKRILRSSKAFSKRLALLIRHIEEQEESQLLGACPELRRRIVATCLRAAGVIA